MKIALSALCEHGEKISDFSPLIRGHHHGKHVANNASLDHKHLVGRMCTHQGIKCCPRTKSHRGRRAQLSTRSSPGYLQFLAVTDPCGRQRSKEGQRPLCQCAFVWYSILRAAEANKPC